MIDKKKRMLYIVPCGVPNDSTSIRVYNVACICKELGIEVDFLSNCYYPNGIKKDEIYDGLSYTYVNSHNGSRVKSMVVNLFELLFSNKTMKGIKRKFKETTYDFIMVYGGSYVLIKFLLTFCRRRNVKLFSDVTEWYEQRKDLPLLSRIRNYQTNKRITELDHKTDGIIAISQFLYDYYKNKGAKVIKMPPVFPKDVFCQEIERKWEKPRLVYAGAPAKKDFLENVYAAVQIINESEIKMEFNIVGISYNDISQLIKNPEAKGMYFHGRLPHKETAKIVRDSDFCILIREPKRYAKAGYSTKFAEAMSNGVAMICNRVGGCDGDIIQWETGILVEDGKIETLKQCFEMIVNMSQQEIEFMKRSAYDYAKQQYCRNNYIESLKEFLLQ